MGIMGNASLMLVDKNKEQEDYQRFRSIEQLVQSGSDLTRQLLGFAKGGKYEVRTTDLNKLIMRSIKMFGRTHKEIDVQTELAKNLNLVEADRSQIDQVLYNLYLNAWQAMNNGGRLFVWTCNRHMDPSAAEPFGLAPGNYIEVLVQDDGTVKTAPSGKTAIEEFQNHHTAIDLVILDVIMSGISGKEAFESFKQIDPNVRVLLCSGYAADGQASEIIKRGCKGFIQKPFSISRLSQKLGQAFQKN